MKYGLQCGSQKRKEERGHTYEHKKRQRKGEERKGVHGLGEKRREEEKKEEWSEGRGEVRDRKKGRERGRRKGE